MNVQNDILRQRTSLPVTFKAKRTPLIQSLVTTPTPYSDSLEESRYTPKSCLRTSESATRKFMRDSDQSIDRGWNSRRFTERRSIASPQPVIKSRKNRPNINRSLLTPEPWTRYASLQQLSVKDEVKEIMDIKVLSSPCRQQIIATPKSAATRDKALINPESVLRLVDLSLNHGKKQINSASR